MTDLPMPLSAAMMMQDFSFMNPSAMCSRLGLGELIQELSGSPVSGGINAIRVFCLV